MFFKMAITQKLLVGISSNFLHSIRTSICIRKCNKIAGDFGAIFLEKYNTEYFKITPLHNINHTLTTPTLQSPLNIGLKNTRTAPLATLEILYRDSQA